MEQFPHFIPLPGDDLGALRAFPSFGLGVDDLGLVQVDHGIGRDVTVVLNACCVQALPQRSIAPIQVVHVNGHKGNLIGLSPLDDLPSQFRLGLKGAGLR